MPWIIASQTIPILAIAPMVIVVLGAVGLTGLVAQGADLDLSVVLPGRGRHGEGPALARADPARPDAHLQCQPRADLLEAALAGVGAVSVRLDEGGGRRSAWSAPSSASCRPGRVAGLGARLLAGSYYGQTVQIWAALVAAAAIAARAGRGWSALAERIVVRRRMGATSLMSRARSCRSSAVAELLVGRRRCCRLDAPARSASAC